MWYTPINTSPRILQQNNSLLRQQILTKDVSQKRVLIRCGIPQRTPRGRNIESRKPADADTSNALSGLHYVLQKPSQEDIRSSGLTSWNNVVQVMSQSNLLRSEHERFASDGECNVWHAWEAVAADYRFSSWAWQALAELLKSRKHNVKKNN